MMIGLSVRINRTIVSAYIAKSFATRSRRMNPMIVIFAFWKH